MSSGPDLVDRRVAALHRATTTLTTTTALIPELEQLWEGMRTRFQPEENAHLTQDAPGAPTTRASRAREKAQKQQFGAAHLIDFLQKRQQGLQEATQTLQNTDIDETGLKNIENRLQGLCPEVEVEDQRWAVLKRCRDLTRIAHAFGAVSDEEIRRMILDKNLEGTEFEFLLNQKKVDRYRQLRMKMQVAVDVVDKGYEWVHIRGTTLKSLARELAEAGWGWAEYGRGDVVDVAEWEECPLTKVTRRLCDAAKLNRKEYVIPKIRIVLPRLNREDDEDIAVFLEQLETIDPDVKVTIDDLSSDFLKAEPPDPETAISLLVGEYNISDDLTPTLNLDSSCLINLISDITHKSITVQDWQAESTRAMITEENSIEGGVMARKLWSVLSGRKLVCTREVAEHFHQVLQTVGTPTERQRGHLLIPQAQPLPSEDIHTTFSALSIHSPPSTFQIPITVLPTDWYAPHAITTAISLNLLPPVAEAVADEARDTWLASKMSVYMQGWSTGDVTVTSERGRGNIIRRLVEENRRFVWEKGPRVFDLGTTRNLLSKNARPPGDWEVSRRPHQGT